MPLLGVYLAISPHISPHLPISRWGVPLLGVVPELSYLSKPTLAELERALDSLISPISPHLSPSLPTSPPYLAELEKALDGDLLAGHRCRSLHYGVENSFLVTTGLRR